MEKNRKLNLTCRIIKGSEILRGYLYVRRITDEKNRRNQITVSIYETLTRYYFQKI